MRRALTVAGGAIAACCIAAVTVAAQPGQAPPPAPTLTQQIDRIFERWDRAGSPGCAVGVVSKGLLVHSQGYGMANLEYGVRVRQDTVFESGSVAKQFTAAAIALLVQDGKLSLDDPVRRHVPELPEFGQPILVRHLLNHTSGLRSQWPMLTLSGRPPGQAVHTVDEILELVGRYKELNFNPGERYLYNNTAYTLLGVIVQRVSGKPLAEFTRDRLFQPLGMYQTSWRDDFTRIVEHRATAYRQLPDGTFRTNMPFTNVIGNGGLLTTIGDLLAWNENLDAPRVGGRAMADLLQTRGRLNDGTELDYALGLVVGEFRGVREVSHGGSTAGYQTFLARFPDHRLSVAVLCNTSGTSPDAYAHQIAELVLKDRLKPVPKATLLDVSPDLLARLAGVYRDRVTDAVAVMAWDPSRKTLTIGGRPVLPTGEGVLMTADGSRTITFDRGGPEPEWPRVGPPLRATERAGRARPVVWHYEKPFAPTAEQLAEFAGEYVCDELDVVYTLYVDGGQLKLRFKPAQRFALTPAFADGFVADGNTIRFTRNGDGRVDGLRVSAGRVIGLRFVRR